MLQIYVVFVVIVLLCLEREGGWGRGRGRDRGYWYFLCSWKAKFYVIHGQERFCNLQKYFTQIFQFQDRLHHKTNTMWSSKVPALLLTLVHVKVFWMEALQECLVHVLSGMLLERQRNPGQHYKCSTLTQGIQMTELSTVRHLPNCTSLWRPQILH